jgi:hypothetical protein
VKLQICLVILDWRFFFEDEPVPTFATPSNLPPTPRSDNVVCKAEIPPLQLPITTVAALTAEQVILGQFSQSFAVCLSVIPALNIFVWNCARLSY